MSSIAMKLCSMILQEHFGDIVRAVGDDLFSAKYRTIFEIMKKTKLTRKQVTSSLAILVQYRLVTYVAIEGNDNTAEYSLHFGNVLLFRRYPRYMYYMQKKKGNLSALLLEEFLRSGVTLAHSAIIQAYNNSDQKDDQTLTELRNTFVDMISEKFLMRTPHVNGDTVPKIMDNIAGSFQACSIEIKDLKEMMENNEDPASVLTERIYWDVNFDKFHQCFRDKVLVEAIERQIDSNAAECFQIILKIMYKHTNAWEPVSNPISVGEIKQVVERKSTNMELVKHIEQYISIIEKDECGFLHKDSGMSGYYNVNMKKAFTQITWSIIDNVIAQKFGAKAARIFRVVRTKKYIEQDEIQREAMIPPKEARLFTYKLLEENLVQIKSIKKSGGMGPAKPIYLFYVCQHQIARDLVETCYKTLYNSIVRVNQDKEASKRLMDKELRLQLVIDSLKERGDSEEAIQEISETLTPPERESIKNSKMRLKRLESSEIMVDEMLFLLQLYLHYHSPSTTIMSVSK